MTIIYCRLEMTSDEIGLLYKLANDAELTHEKLVERIIKTWLASGPRIGIDG